MEPLRLLSPDPETGPWVLSAEVLGGAPDAPVLVRVRWGVGPGASFSRTLLVGPGASGHEAMSPVGIARELTGQATLVSAPLPPASEVIHLLERARREGLKETVRRAVRLARGLPTDDIMSAVGEALAEEVMDS